jgi:hypothetical protein
LHHEHRVVIGGGPRYTLYSDSDVASRHGVVTDLNFGTDERRFLLRGGSFTEFDGRGRGREGSEVVLGEFDEGSVFDSSSSDEDHSVSGVVRLDVVGKVVTGDGEDVFLGTEDSSSEGLSYEGG